MCVCGTLFRDLEVTKKQKRPDQEPEQPSARRSLSNASSSALMNSGMPEVEELRSLLEKGDISVLFSQEELSECPRLSSSLVNLPTYVTSEVNHILGSLQTAVWPDWAIFLTLGNFLWWPLTTINLPESSTFLGNFCEGVKIIHFSCEIIFGQLYRHLAIFIWSHYRQCSFGPPCSQQEVSIIQSFNYSIRIYFSFSVYFRFSTCYNLNSNLNWKKA